MIKHVDENLLQVQADVIAHQVNCQGVMGAGIAKQIRNRLLSREQFLEYVNLCRKHHGNLLGNVHWCLLKDGRRIANLFGQNFYGREKRHTDYGALAKGFENIERNMVSHGLITLAIPNHMGCCNAGGDWDTVYQIITDRFAASPVTCIIAKYPDNPKTSNRR